MSNRLPVYLLIDSSGSMNGEPIHSVNEGLRAMMSALKQDLYALDTVHLSLITFDREIKEIFPLTPIRGIEIEDIVPPSSGPTHLGEALEYIIECYSRDNHQNDFLPMLFVMTDGKPSDVMLFDEMSQKIKKLNFSSIIGCAAGPKAKTEYLQKFSTSVISMEMVDSSSFLAFFKWVSDSISKESQNKATSTTEDTTLPPPPSEINMVL